ncbi:BatA domain-containing protein [Allorhodopirellula solitaria]|uniref:Aerotolerance regulator N-terminal domain-containing protein n=1 Tax=Allorhodopirellula solitaria TaxID=2527987 RepID=A0A5C5X180_9BACT|nr:BatA domain-containing protein [Allorhodopirellula solitaria]TWT56051.1 hypothetical protein CA85_46430 [Allorhodopirellula solitaria]
MSFLQPWMLVALPLALIPIIIHLINQRRFQSTQWAAMMFLLSANRMNRGYAKIRQWLILALRALVIAALVFAIGRPIASGLLGGSVAGSITGRGPANTIVLLDRSPSMQASSDGTSRTKLETGVAEIAETLQTIGTQRLVLIESNAVTPREVASPADLLELPEAGPSDASADIPAMMLAALDHINANQLGQTEIWICSDLRSHDWRGDDGRWSSLQDAFAEFGRRVRFRLLAFAKPAIAGSTVTDNRSVRMDDAHLEKSDDDAESEVLISLKITADEEDAEVAAQSVPVTLDLDQSRSVVDVGMRGGVGQISGHRVPLSREQTQGYGSVAIPADFNAADNRYYFTFDTPPPQRTVVVSDNEEIGRVLKLAAEITPDENLQSVAEVVSPRDLAGISWEDVSLVLWQAALPSGPDSGGPDSSGPDSGGDAAAMLQSFVDRGGRVIFFPPESSGELAASAELFGMQWQQWEDVEGEHAVSSWRGDADLLAATMAGSGLPVGTLRVNRSVGIEGEATALAKLADGSPLLSRVPTPQGGVYFCSTTPLAKDSSLAADGVVLYVMIQRALAAGALSLGNTSQVDAGAVPASEAERWQRLAGRDSALSSENAFVAGVFRDRDSGRLIAINRSADEDAISTLGDEQVEALFGDLPFVRVDRTAGRSNSLVEEVWRAFLILMLVAMIGEACLCLPRLRPADDSAVREGVSA